MKKEMKNVVVLSLLSFVLVITGCSQSMDAFFKHEGVETLALFAHPTNTYEGGQYKVYSNKVWVRIYYKEYTAEYYIYRSGDVFTGIGVINDPDPVAPFLAVWFFKEMAIELSKEQEHQKATSAWAEKLRIDWENMTGKDLACLVLTIEWWAY